MIRFLLSEKRVFGSTPISRTVLQSERYDNWIQPIIGKKVITIELGAGTTIPTVREESQKMFGATIRINSTKLMDNGIL